MLAAFLTTILFSLSALSGRRLAHYVSGTQANLLRLRGAGYAAPVTSLENAVHDYVRKYLVPDKRFDPAIE